MSLLARAILIGSFILSILTMTFWKMLSFHYEIKGVYYLGTALSTVGFLWVIRYFIKKHCSDRWVKIVGEIIFATSINNLVDELFFDPQKIGINEYIGFLLIIALAICQSIEWKK